MFKSFHFGMALNFERQSSPGQLHRLVPRIQMAHAASSYWKREEDEAIIQEFDGQQGYLHHVAIALRDARTVAVHVERHDLHILYVLSAEAPIELRDAAGHILMAMPPGRACYLYLPPGQYAIRFAPGSAELFGFYFNGRIFRQGNERPYTFIAPLIGAFRSKSSHPLCSITFRVGPQTRQQIDIICRDLRAQQLHNESFIYSKLIQLIELSRLKVLEEESKADHTLRIAKQARRLLAFHIDTEGQAARISALEDDLLLDIATINRYHQRCFGCSLRTLRDSLLLDRAKTHLRSGLTATQTAYMLNYSELAAFSRFFKKQCGCSVQAFLRCDLSCNDCG